MDFGTYISKIRKERKMSQKELASQIKKEDGTPISPQYLNDIERNRRNPPSEDMIKQIAEILELSTDYVHFLAGKYPKDISGKSYSADRIKAAYTAFRQELEKG